MTIYDYLYIFAIYMEHILKKCTGFDWDDGNSVKNWFKHLVSQRECEQVFFNKPIIITNDVKHSQIGMRYYLLGKTDNDRLLLIVFTVRETLIRIISARDMSKKERTIYEKK